MQIISDVIVDKISLVTKGNMPAVDKAETKFSIFKIFTKTKITKEQINKLDDLQSRFEKISKGHCKGAEEQ